MSKGSAFLIHIKTLILKQRLDSSHVHVYISFVHDRSGALIPDSSVKHATVPYCNVFMCFVFMGVQVCSHSSVFSVLLCHANNLSEAVSCEVTWAGRDTWVVNSLCRATIQLSKHYKRYLEVCQSIFYRHHTVCEAPEKWCKSTFHSGANHGVILYCTPQCNPTPKSLYTE